MSSSAASLLIGSPGDAELTERFIAPELPRRFWTVGWMVSGSLVGLLLIAVIYTVLTGIGTWGNNVPVGWGLGIIHFVWWIGIGHAGTFISAILLLLQQHWRTSINRIAEAMTLFALVQAALYPLLHLGRAWFFYWLLPYPATFDVYPQFMSPITWDFAAVLTYGVTSLLFFYLGLLPDLAGRRDRTRGRARAVYAVFALGFCGSARQWRHHRVAQLLLAGLATPLVVSVHSIVSTDFAVSLLPGWHSTLFPPYFVAGAIFSGFAMVLTLAIPVRHVLGLHAVITPRHLDLMAKLMLVTGLVVAYGYLVEHFLAWRSDLADERRMFLEVRPFGTYAPVFWAMLGCNVLAPQLLWSARVRRSPLALLLVSLLVNVGMWAERFVIVVTSQHAGFLPSSDRLFLPSPVDLALFAGTCGLFGLLFLLLLRFVPFVPVAELKEMRRALAQEAPHGR